ncbi:hypothetical protein ACFE04_021727 [Oxalis oulophora]
MIKSNSNLREQAKQIEEEGSYARAMNNKLMDLGMQKLQGKSLNDANWPMTTHHKLKSMKETCMPLFEALLHITASKLEAELVEPLDGTLKRKYDQIVYDDHDDGDDIEHADADAAGRKSRQGYSGEEDDHKYISSSWFYAT